MVIWYIRPCIGLCNIKPMFCVIKSSWVFCNSCLTYYNISLDGSVIHKMLWTSQSESWSPAGFWQGYVTIQWTDIQHGRKVIFLEGILKVKVCGRVGILTEICFYQKALGQLGEGPQESHWQCIMGPTGTDFWEYIIVHFTRPMHWVWLVLVKIPWMNNINFSMNHMKCKSCNYL